MLRGLYQRVVPQPIRRAVRMLAREVPIRIRDAGPDFLDRFRGNPLPPARLRAAVGINSSRAHYVDVGRRVAGEIVAAAGRRDGAWLDFGCGSGRVARHIAQIDGISLTGVDIDRTAIGWMAARRARLSSMVIDPHPPLPFDGASFDVVYSVSVFTHFDEQTQFAWLAELRRVLRDRGVLVATLHGPQLTYNRPDLSAGQHQALASRGFAFASGTGAFNEDSAFHTREYVLREWERFFRSVDHRRSALFDYQDVAIGIA